MMRIRVSTHMTDHLHQLSAFDLDDEQNLHKIELAHNSIRYEITVRNGQIEFRDIEGRQLIVTPKAANLIGIASEEWQ